jgi:Spy/CpxP family protein refolding chaperone
MRPRLPQMLVLTALALACAPGANAQSTQGAPPGAPPAPGATQPSQNIPDQKLDAAAAALQKVVNLQHEYRQKLAGANGEAEQQKIIAEANNELTRAVTDQGLSLEEYTSIMQVAQNDPQVRDKLLQRIDPGDNPGAR